jgi:hypothetical protein
VTGNVSCIRAEIKYEDFRPQWTALDSRPQALLGKVESLAIMLADRRLDTEGDILAVSQPV